MFKGPVAWTEKMTATELNPTECNWTISCSCLVLGLVGLLVASIQKYLKTVQKPVAIGCNQSFIVYIISYKHTDNKKKNVMKVLIITI